MEGMRPAGIMLITPLGLLLLLAFVAPVLVMLPTSLRIYQPGMGMVPGWTLHNYTQIATDPIPWDREFPGTRHYSVGYLSYRLPTIMDVPKQTQVYIDSLEPRWFYGIKSFSETSIGSVPGALANAIYNACGVRIREHPITREKIMAGLKARGVKA